MMLAMGSYVAVWLLGHIRLFHDPMDCKLSRFLGPWNFLGKKTGVGCHFLFQRSSQPRDQTHHHVWPLLGWGTFLLCSLYLFKIINGCWIKSFLSIEKTIRFSSFINVAYHIDLGILSHLWIPGISPTWAWCMVLLMYCIWFASVLLRTFQSVFIRHGTVSVLLSGFVIWVMLALKMSWCSPTSSVF